MISKELLSEVLGCDCSECYFEDTYNLINYKYQYDVTWSEEIQYNNSSINIHELAHKCKEWAYEDKSLCGYNIELKSYKSENCYWLCELMSEDITFSEESEPESIFEACQWILENKEIK